MFWRPVKLTREQGFRVIELRKAFIKCGAKRDLNGLIVAGREELRQLVDCGAISHREHDDLEMEYSRLFSARLLQFVPLNQPIKTAPAANEPVAEEPTPRSRIKWRHVFALGMFGLGMVAGFLAGEWVAAGALFAAGPIIGADL
jgi:hypothetical protein